MSGSVESFLIFHVVVVSVTLTLMVFTLNHRGLFRWNTAGFWAWVSFLLYYVLNPLFSLRQENINRYSMHLFLAGGIERGEWILFVIVIGILVFFTTYQQTRFTKITWGLKEDVFNIPMRFVVALFVAFGSFSLIAYRSSAVFTRGELIIQDGRFAGQVTGYENAGYLFLYVPIVSMLLARSRAWRLIGGSAALAFIYLTLPSGWGRVIPISFLLAFSMVDTAQRKTNWPRKAFIPLLLILTVSLQMRGHITWKLSYVGRELFDLAVDSIMNIGSAVASPDTSMLPSWYIESMIKDNITGYDYAIPLFNYALTGWIPNRIFPQKYFLTDWLRSTQPPLPGWSWKLLYGSKPSLLGSFYSEGGILAVVVMSAVAGFLSRKLDGMLADDNHFLVRATGIAWLSVLWMVWGSRDTWGLMIFGVMVIPVLAMWIVARKKSSLKEFKSYVGSASDYRKP